MSVSLSVLAPEVVLGRTLGVLDEGWCQGGYARDANGAPCGALEDRACAWCIEGGMQRAIAGVGHEVDRDVSYGHAVSVIEAILAERGVRARPAVAEAPFIVWQDAPWRSYEDVRALIVEAIRRAGLS